jgi:hypothetical protein
MSKFMFYILKHIELTYDINYSKIYKNSISKLVNFLLINLNEIIDLTCKKQLQISKMKLKIIINIYYLH